MLNKMSKVFKEQLRSSWFVNVNVHSSVSDLAYYKAPVSIENGYLILMDESVSSKIIVL